MPRTVLRPLQEVLRTTTAGGAILLAAAVLALAWANAPFRDSYERLWGTEIALTVGSWGIEEDLRHWVNDGLMALFFLVVGLEIKRELTIGELRRFRAAALPVVAAVGGMAVPALLYVALNAGTAAVHGWGIPMATDIAFALGVLTLAAASAPSSLQPFLLTLAIVDDIGAIIVIALFYAGGVSWPALAVGALIVGAVWLFQRVGIRATSVYVALGIGLWLAVYRSGVHPTIAGVAMGLLTPAHPFQRPRAVSDEAERTAQETLDEPQPPDADAHWWLRLAWLSREAVSPLARLEHVLLPWTSFVVLPLFALANAGVELSASALRGALTSDVGIGIVVGLVVGKLVGVWGAGTLAARVGLAVLPAGVGPAHLAGAAAVAGIGFTVSLFIAELAFADPVTLARAKIAVLAASIVAGALGLAILRSRGDPVGGSHARSAAASSDPEGA